MSSLWQALLENPLAWWAALLTVFFLLCSIDYRALYLRLRDWPEEIGSFADSANIVRHQSTTGE